MVRMSESSFLSSDGKSSLYCCEYLPEGSPAGIVQIVHGLGEYSARYDHFARFLADNGIHTIDFLYNNAFFADGLIICGSRLWDGVGTNSAAEDIRAYAREVGRLRMSLEAGKRVRGPYGGEIVAFTHYPPWATDNGRPAFMELLAEFGVRRCCYGHLHGSAIEGAREGDHGGVELRLVSADHLDFAPLKISAS